MRVRGAHAFNGTALPTDEIQRLGVVEDRTRPFSGQKRKSERKSRGGVGLHHAATRRASQWNLAVTVFGLLTVYIHEAQRKFVLIRVRPFAEWYLIFNNLYVLKLFYI